MEYNNIVEGKFISRPNRFIANVLIDGKEEIVHVKNTGRCKELLLPNSKIFLEDCQSPTRKTRYDLISVYKRDRLINMDSQVPNDVVEELLKTKNFLPDIHHIKREQFFGNSRFDFYVEYQDKKAYMEVKGVTLETDNIAMFPDAPTQRGTKHLRELVQAKNLGYEAYVIFVIQMEGIEYFTPNKAQDLQFSQALVEAKSQGVNILAIDCTVTSNTIAAKNLIPIKL
ncbi:MAG: DNA/RNA nuclease SfsA [Filifactoraceae bacterium]